MPKDRKNLDFHSLVRQPDFEWIRLYFEKNYPNKNFVISVEYEAPLEKKEGVYYAYKDVASHHFLKFKNKNVIARGVYALADEVPYDNTTYRLQFIKIQVI